MPHGFIQVHDASSECAAYLREEDIVAIMPSKKKHGIDLISDVYFKNGKCLSVCESPVRIMELIAENHRSYI